MAERLLLDIANVDIPDASGTIRRCRFLLPGPAIRTYPNVPDRRAARSLVWAIWRRVAVVIIGASVVLSGVAVGANQALLAFVLPRSAGPGSLLWGTAAVSVTTIVAMFATYELIVNPVWRRYYRPIHVRTILERARCPHCLYDLVAQVADAEQRITCPECGAVWRRPEPDHG
jgi:hypothetical protein